MQRILSESEREILDNTARGDKNAFSVLFNTYHQDLGSFLVRLTRSSVLAEEIVQETFLKIWLNRSELTHIKSFRAYLFTISRNQALNALRDETRRIYLSDEDLSEMMLTDDPSGFHHEKEELFTAVEQAVTLLPPQQQKAWKLNKEQGLPYQKVAEQMKLSPETVKRHISLATASISKHLKIHGSWISIYLGFLLGL